MDAPTAIVVQGTEVVALLQALVWTLMRVGAAAMCAPLIGSRALPVRVRLFLAIALSAVLAPLLDTPTGAPALDATLVMNVLRELTIGAVIGFVFRAAFEAGALAGELVSAGMGLSFAQMADPMRGTSSPVLGQWFAIVFGLLFFALDAHLGIVHLLVVSYQGAPIGAPLQDTQALLLAAPQFLGQALAVGVQMALPVTIAMLSVNIAFGVLARAAPALNPIAVGLPAALMVGLVLLVALMPVLVDPIRALFEAAGAAAHFGR